MTARELGRATLARQLLLERTPLGVVEAVEALAGMQAQEPRPPHIGLWSRLAGFEPAALLSALRERAVLRAPLWRGTLHLVSAADFAALRGPCAPALALAARGQAQRAGIEPARVVEVARAGLSRRPHTQAQLRELMAGSFPGADARALAYVARMLVPLALEPSADEWGFPRDPALAPAEHGRGTAAELVRRYLAAFGPSSRADIADWSGLRVADFGPALELLEPLRRFRDETGRELLDVQRAPLPPADTPAPVRFLPKWDNTLLAHADRRRVLPEELRKAVIAKNGDVTQTVLVDGIVAASWAADPKGKVTVTPFAPLPRTARRAVDDEAALLEAWLAA